MIVPINIRLGDQKVDFSMDVDDGDVCDNALMHYLSNGGPPEPETCFVMLRCLKPGMTAVDAGANIGFFSLLMSKLVGETGQVFAFEPGQNNIIKLKANLALNDCKNVKVIEKPLWSSLTSVEVYHYKDGGANSLWPLAPSDKSLQMASTTLDAECSEVDLIKLDIEGAEVRALRGAWKLLRQFPVIVTEMNEAALERAGTSFEEMRTFLRNYDCFGLSKTGHFPTWHPKDIEMRAVRQNTNVMFARMEQVKDMWPKAFL